MQITLMAQQQPTRVPARLLLGLVVVTSFILAPVPEPAPPSSTEVAVDTTALRLAQAPPVPAGGVGFTWIDGILAAGIAGLFAAYLADRRSHAAAMAKLAEDQRAELVKVDAAHKAELLALASEHRREIVAERDRHKAEMDAVYARHQQEIRAERSKIEEGAEWVRTNYAENVQMVSELTGAFESMTTAIKDATAAQATERDKFLKESRELVSAAVVAAGVRAKQPPK